MTELKTKAIKNLEERLESIDPSSMRHVVLETVKSFKVSWLDLGQILYTVWKDRLYKDWGYSTFDAYTKKEIGIKKETAMKLLKSYEFLEKEEPRFLKSDYQQKDDAAAMPTFEAVDVLRRAKNKKDLDKIDYETIRKSVLDHGKDASDVRKSVTQMIRQREELEPEEARLKKKVTVLRRFLSALKNVTEEIKVLKWLPVKTVKQAEELIKEIEREVA